MSSVVVISNGRSGLEFGARLAMSGLSVRVLGESAAHLGASHPDLLQYGTVAEQQRLCAGSAFQSCAGPDWLLVGGSVRPAFGRRLGVVGQFRDALRRVGDVRSDGFSWIRDHVRDGEEASLVMTTILGSSGVRPTVEEARQYFAIDRSWFAGDAESWRRQLITNGGGDVVDEVEFGPIELLKGRIHSIETDVGRDWVDEALFFDVPLGQFVSLLPDKLRSTLQPVAALTPLVHHVEACVEVGLADVPDLAMVIDPSGAWRVRVIRNKVGVPSSIVCDFTYRPEESGPGEAERRFAEFISATGGRIQCLADPTFRCFPFEATSRRFVRLLEALNRVGVFHVHQGEAWLAARERLV